MSKNAAPARSTPRQRVLDALAHRQPTRVPFSWGFGPTDEMQQILKKFLAEHHLDWNRLAEAAEDKTGAGPAFVKDLLTPGRSDNGWGIKTHKVEYQGGAYQEFTDFPLAKVESPSELDDYPWPSAEPFDYAGLPAAIERANPGRRKAVQCGGGNPFEIYCWMTGLEQSLTNMLVNPDVVVAALGHITDFMEAHLQQILQAAGDLTDMIFFADDLGTQHGLMISRQMYRDILQPFHKRLTRCARTYAPRAISMLHSDGAVFDMLDDLIDAGIQLLEAVQVDADGMDPQRLKDTFGDRLSFHGGLSVQQLLPRHDEKFVEEECRRLVGIFGRNGGYVAAPSHAIQVGTPPANALAMLRGVLGPEDYDAVLEAAKI